MFFHHPFDVFDDDNRIVDHDADRQNNGQQRNGVRRVADGQQCDERADEADWHRQRRNERGPHIAEEKKDDDHNKNESFNKGLLHLVDGVFDENGRIIGNFPCQIFRERLL